MLHRRIIPGLLMAMSALAACEPDPSALTSPPESELTEPLAEADEVLDFVVPRLRPSDLTTTTVTVREPPPDGPALADQIGDDESERPIQAIMNAKTTVSPRFTSTCFGKEARPLMFKSSPTHS